MEWLRCKLLQIPVQDPALLESVSGTSDCSLVAPFVAHHRASQRCHLARGQGAVGWPRRRTRSLNRAQGSGVFMAAWISAWLSARPYTRTSSARPLKNSPHMLLPPMRSGPLEDGTAPETAVLATGTPLMNRRSVVPS